MQRSPRLTPVEPGQSVDCAEVPLQYESVPAPSLWSAAWTPGFATGAVLPRGVAGYAPAPAPAYGGWGTEITASPGEWLCRHRQATPAASRISLPDGVPANVPERTAIHRR